MARHDRGGLEYSCPNKRSQASIKRSRAVHRDCAQQRICVRCTGTSSWLSWKREMKDGTGADLSPRKLKASAESLDDRATDPQSYAHSFGPGGKGWPEHAKRITSRMFCSFVSSVLYGPRRPCTFPQSLRRHQYPGSARVPRFRGTSPPSPRRLRERILPVFGRILVRFSSHWRCARMCARDCILGGGWSGGYDGVKRSHRYKCQN